MNSKRAARKYTTAITLKCKTYTPIQWEDYKILENKFDTHKSITIPSLTKYTARSSRWRRHWGCWWWNWKKEICRGKDYRPVWEGGKHSSYIINRRDFTKILYDHMERKRNESESENSVIFIQSEFQEYISLPEHSYLKCIISYNEWNAN